LTWAWIGTAWFLALSVLATATKVKIRFVPHIVSAVVLVALGWLVGKMLAGPLFTLPFLFCAFSGSVLALLKKSEPYPATFVRGVCLIGLLSWAAIAATIVEEAIRPTPRTPADVILRWEGTVSEREAFRALRKAEPGSVDSYRRIVKQAGLFAVDFAAQRLVEIGDPKVDVPLLIDALGRPYIHYVADPLEEDLRKMTGLALPDGTSQEAWRKAWRDHTSGREKAAQP
jgi:hypothetical protein